ncbi:unnamed protein product [Heterobilharzia americana]|nr:unnamed protein product [Heterobilharzia americana]
MAVNYGCVFSAFTVGSILCAIISTFITSQDAYLIQFSACGCVCILALVISFWIEDRKMPKHCNICNCCSAACPTLRVGYYDPSATQGILEEEEEEEE